MKPSNLDGKSPVEPLAQGNQFTARLVLHPANRGWILEKCAVRLVENLVNWNVKADISDKPSEEVDINHWMLYLSCQGERHMRGTTLITHVIHPRSLWMVKESLKVVDVGICLSAMGVEDLVRRGVRQEQLCYITPAHDGLMRPRRIVIGITSRMYPDHRKREDLLLKLADAMRLDAFHFEIIGQGWEEITARLEASGATVRHYPGTEDYEQDYRVSLERVPTYDYYLYTGLDDGSMGFLDALAAGVGTIVTPQGFHLDIEDGITYSFNDAAQLVDIFQRLAKERQRRVDSVKDLTWNKYARKHAIVWRALLNGQQDEISSILRDQTSGVTAKPLRPLGLAALWKDAKFYAIPVHNRIKRMIERFQK